MKKKKLNSKNPKYHPKDDVVKEEIRRELIKDKKGVKIYAIFKS